MSTFATSTGASSPEEWRALLAAIVADSDDAIVSKDLKGIVRSWNAGAERVFGYTAAEMIGKSITVLFPPDRLDEEPRILERLKRGERVDHFETVRIRKDGRPIDISVTISPVKDGTGRVVGASKVARDVTSIRRMQRAQEELLAREQAARQEAERLNRLKDEFLATLSHELRTPLNAILGWAQLLRGPLAGSDEVGQGLETIERNARVQAQMIDDLLDISRIVNGKVRLDVRGVNLAEVVGTAIESIRPAAEAKQIRIEYVSDGGEGVTRGDRQRLNQVVWNLLTNAVKFTPRGGEVRIALRDTGSGVELVVTDTGEGIPAEFLPRLFDRFSQADGSTTRRHGGLGLGLAIVRHMVELHGGTVRASSAGPGLGATFTVELPTVAAVDNEPPGVPGLEGAAPAKDGGPGVEAQAALKTRVDLSGVRVLVVDDEADAAGLVRRLLTLARATVTTAASAAEGLEAVRRERPDILISDIAMPGEDGYQLLAKVRRLPRSEGGATPAVALTAFARPDDRRRALLAGFQMHLPKPIEATELLAIVGSLSGVVRGGTDG